MNRIDQQIEADFFAIGSNGEGVGNIVSPENLRGMKVFVPGLLPGERATIQPDKISKRMVSGSLIELMSKSPHRTKPPCRYFGKCGGCQLQHMQLEPQRLAKLEMVKSLLGRQAGLTPQQGIGLLGTDLPGYEYRRRVQFQVDRSGRIGFHQVGTHSVIEVQQCHISEPAINSVLKTLHSYKRLFAETIARCEVEFIDGQICVTLAARSADMDVKHLHPLLQEFDDLQIVFKNLVLLSNRSKTGRTGGFAQVNEAANRLLVETVVNKISCQQALDMYAGSGNFALPLAQSGLTVTAVEWNPGLVSCGRELAENANTKLRFVRSRCEDYPVEKHSGSLILDPPRAGAAKLIDRILPGLTQIVYVSCNPATFMRDAKLLLQKGYSLKTLEVLDMFPQTAHVELIAEFN